MNENRNILPSLFASTLAVAILKAAAVIAEVLPPVDERFAPPAGERITEVPDFQRHVVPLFSRLGCNGRACHGSFQGKGGFRLSMFGYDFSADCSALKSTESPRVDITSPADSLILTRPVSEDEHGGGKRFEPGGWEYRVLLQWIEAGANGVQPDAPRLSKLVVTPTEILFDSDGQTAQLRVVAHWSDDTMEDVSPIARYATRDDDVANVDLNGRVTSAGCGATYLIVCYDNHVESIPVMQAVSDHVGPNYPDIQTPTTIDKLVVDRLRKLGIVPSDLCTDAEFLRRASIDVCGSLPTPAEIEAFLDDTSPDKRTRKIDELLRRPEYAVWWATLFSDLTGLNAASELGSTEYAKYAGEQWYSWLRRRIADNDGYDEIARGIILASSRRPNQSYDDYVMEIVSYMRKDDPVDFAAQPWMPYYWFRSNLSSTDDKALSFAHTFLGVRLECAQCHKHPFDQWSQKDFKDFAAFFDRVSKGIHPDAVEDKRRLEERLEVSNLKNAAERRGTYRRWAIEGKPAPYREVFIAPPAKDRKGNLLPSPTLRILGGEPVTLAPDEDPRKPIMDWLLEKDNPYFGPAMVNRIWAHYLGVGIVDPVDDFNRGNPPENRQLLDYLSREFIEHGYDLKHVQRLILNSRTYQLSCRTNETNRSDVRQFSTWLVRRLPAEVVADAIIQATASSTPSRPKGFADPLMTRYIAKQAPAREQALDYPMLLFGKPIRKINCDCERQDDPSLLQSVYLRNDVDLLNYIRRTDGWMAGVPTDADPAALVREAYLRTVSRPPTDGESMRCLQFFNEASSPVEALEDVIWALLNTQEFITSH